MVNQTKHYVFTLNNWTAEEDDALKALGPSVSYLVYGYETGENGTPHLQGYIVFPKVKRFREAKTTIGIDRIHLETKRGTPEQASNYCKKDGVFQEFGTCPRSPGSGGQFAVFIDWILSRKNGPDPVPSLREIAQAFPALYVRYHRKLLELAKHHAPRPVLEDGEDLKPWQNDLKAVLLEVPPDDRSILFYVDQEGGKGKSWFQRYMVTNYPDKVQLFSCGKRDDIAHAVDESKSIFLFNIPRKGMEYFQFASIEQLKDRMVFSPKYDSTMKLLKTNPHVVVFSNEYPDMDKLTADRYIIEDEF